MYHNFSFSHECCYRFMVWVFVFVFFFISLSQFTSLLRFLKNYMVIESYKNQFLAMCAFWPSNFKYLRNSSWVLHQWLMYSVEFCLIMSQSF